MPGTGPLLPSPPRRVVSRSRAARFGRWTFRLFLLPHTLVGIGGLFAVPFLICWAIAGQVVHGEFVDVHTGFRHSGKMENGVSLPYTQYGYRYTFQGKEYRKSTESDEDGYFGLPKDSAAIAALHRPIDVRVFGIGSWHYADRAGKSPWKTVGFAVLFVAFWNSIVSVFVYLAWIGPLRERWLIANGLARPGKIAESTADGEGSNNIAYEYQSDGRSFRRKMRMINRLRAVPYPVGSAVTVLVHPFNEKRAVVYELSNYQAEGERL